MAEDFDMGAVDAPENKEKAYLRPGYRKLTVTGFSYEKEAAGKTPNIIMKLTGKDSDGNEVEFKENFYMSGKLNDKGIMISVLRLQELYKGLTGNEKMTIKTGRYSYVKTEPNGMENHYTIPDPTQITEYLNKTCKGITAVFKVGGEIAEDGTVYTKLAYTGFLYYVDKSGALTRYKAERDFTETEYKNIVRKRKSQGAPLHGAGVADTRQLDDLQ